MTITDLLASLDVVLIYKVVGSIAAVLVYLVIRWFRNRAIDRIACARNMAPVRVAATRRAVRIVSRLALAIVIGLIFSIKVQGLVAVSGAVMATFGFAFLTEWSILSNITANIVMFWRFPIRIGDRIAVPDRPALSGVVRDLTPFFIIVTDENGNTVTIPNNTAFQQSIVIYDCIPPEEIRRQAEAEQSAARPGPL